MATRSRDHTPQGTLSRALSVRALSSMTRTIGLQVSSLNKVKRRRQREREERARGALAACRRSRPSAEHCVEGDDANVLRSDTCRAARRRAVGSLGAPSAPRSRDPAARSSSRRRAHRVGTERSTTGAKSLRPRGRGTVARPEAAKLPRAASRTAAGLCSLRAEGLSPSEGKSRATQA